MNKKIYPLLIALWCFCFVTPIRTTAAGLKSYFTNPLNIYNDFGFKGGVVSETINTPDVFLTFPADKQSANINGTFKCKQVTGATTYTLELSDTNTFAQILANYNSPQPQFFVQGLQYSKLYYARVKTDLTAVYGKTTSFTTKAAETYTFISVPRNGAINVDPIDLKITANLVAGASHYTIEVSPTNDFSSDVIIRSSKVPNQRTINFDRLPYNTLLYARVKTNVSSYGKISTFKTREEQFSSQINPSHQSQNLDPSVLKVTVGTLAKAKRYTIEVNTKADFTGLSWTKTSTEDYQTEFIFNNLPYGITIYTRVKADISTGFGPIRSFSTRQYIQQQRLWGLTTTGGTYDRGTVFSFSVDSLKFTKHHDYIGINENSFLSGSLVQGPDRKLYGNSNVDDSSDDADIFYIDQDNSFHVYNHPQRMGSVIMGSNNYLYVLHDWINIFRGGIYRFKPDQNDFSLDMIVFKLRSDFQGSNPQAPLVEGSDGYLYGTAPFGGTSKKGTLFKVRLDGKDFQLIHTFNGTTGANPNSSVVLGDDGFIYGMTPAGGAFNNGVIFKVKTDGTGYEKLLDFIGLNGKMPLGSLIIDNGSLFGMTSEGGAFDNGVIFRISKDGSGFSKLYDFKGNDGSTPTGTLSAGDDGTLYGMTSRGGVNNYGVIFKINPNGTSFSKLFDFSAETGGAPDGDLLLLEDTFEPQPVFASKRLSSTQLSIHPNPFQTNFTAQIDTQDSEEVRMILTDMHGVVLKDSKASTNQSIEAGDDLDKGLYILKVIKGQEVIVERLVKN